MMDLQGPKGPAHVAGNHWAKLRRLSRLRSTQGAYLLLALDHGLSLGPLQGIENLDLCSDSRLQKFLTGIVLNQGTATRVLAPTSRLGLVLQLCGSLGNNPDDPKVRLINPEDALLLNPDAVAVELHLDRSGALNALRDVADTVTRCGKIGIPVLLMLSAAASGSYITNLAHALRVSTELGVDLIKVGLPVEILSEDLANLSTFAKAIEFAPPLLLAGGPPNSDFIGIVKRSRDLGFSGFCVGRNLFQASDPFECIEMISSIYSTSDRSTDGSI